MSLQRSTPSAHGPRKEENMPRKLAAYSLLPYSVEKLSKTDGAESAPYSLNLLLAAAVFFLAHLRTDKISDASQNSD